MSPPTFFSMPRDSVTVTTPARLHLGFLDLHGGLGRRFGSLGLTIDELRTTVTVRRHLSGMAVSHARLGDAEGFGGGIQGGDDRQRPILQCSVQKEPAQDDRAPAGAARDHLQRLATALQLNEAFEVQVAEAIPEHLGLGSGTQMALAIGTALSHLVGLPANTRVLANRLDRGARSGIGIGAFDQGGFLMDSGRSEHSGPPPVTARLPFPEAWRIALILDVRGQGLHGHPEIEAFRRLPPFPQEQAAHLCHMALMQILPALSEANLEPFAQGIGELQRVVGDYFAPAQGGRFTSPQVAEALAFAESHGLSGVGQSSWGPTGFVLLPDAASAAQWVTAAKRRFDGDSLLRFRVVAACNHGHRLSFTPPPAGMPRPLAAPAASRPVTLSSMREP